MGRHEREEDNRGRWRRSSLTISIGIKGYNWFASPSPICLNCNTRQNRLTGSECDSLSQSQGPCHNSERFSLSRIARACKYSNANPPIDTCSPINLFLPYINWSQLHKSSLIPSHGELKSKKRKRRNTKMGKMNAFFLVTMLVMCLAASAVSGNHGDHEIGRGKGEGEGGRKRKGQGSFLLRHSKQVVKTEAGEMRVVKGCGGRSVERPMHIGFITMEPNTLFVPQYLDSNLILFIRKGEARVGLVCRDELVEKTLKEGDLYRIEAGSAFYLVSTANEERLRAICSFDRSETSQSGILRSFFLAGGTNPTSVLAGFNNQTLANAFNASAAEVRELMSKQQSGPIVRLSDSHPQTMWTHFLDLEEHQRLAHLKKLVHFQGEEKAPTQAQLPTWSWRKLLGSIFEKQLKTQDSSRSRGSSASPDPYNLYNRQPDFQNNYGWSIDVEESDYSSLSNSGVGIHLLNLSAGSMMAPHMNPTATEYGVVLSGRGRIQIVYPDGSSAMDAEVREGDVFWVPRFFPFCQTACENGALEIFGFTTSARKKNRPQFLVGRNSVLQGFSSRETAAAFDVSRERAQEILNAQRESVILPSSASQD